MALSLTWFIIYLTPFGLLVGSSPHSVGNNHVVNGRMSFFVQVHPLPLSMQKKSHNIYDSTGGSELQGKKD